MRGEFRKLGSPFLLKKMATFWESLSEKSREDWPEIYQKFKGKKWENPIKDERGIQAETKIEDIEEIDRLMRQKPNYSIDIQGRGKGE